MPEPLTEAPAEDGGDLPEEDAVHERPSSGIEEEEPLMDLETAVKQISPALREEMATLLKAEFRAVIRLENAGSGDRP
ncbi:MAG: hypothetical protein R6V45_10195 [Oceanipulchritudo sp.]